MISLSGLIKVPKKMFATALDLVRQIFLSHAYYWTKKDPKLEPIHLIVGGLLRKHGLDLIPQHKLSASMFVSADFDDVPEYRKFLMQPTPSLKINIDVSNKYKGSYGVYFGNFTIILNPIEFREALTGNNVNESVPSAMHMIESTLLHEFTHYVQDVTMHPSNKRKNYTYGQPFTEKDYYGSPIEFDPTLKSSLDEFCVLLISIEKRHKIVFDPNVINQAIRLWLGQKSSLLGMWNNPYLADQTKAIVELHDKLNASRFFVVLKKHDKIAYTKAAKLFVSNIKQSIDYVRHAIDVEQLDLKRLDTVWCGLRQNEFLTFVQAMQALAAWPEQRLQTIKSLLKYLDRVDDKFKNVEQGFTIVPVTRSLSESLKAGKKFKMPYIFGHSSKEKAISYAEELGIGNGWMFLTNAKCLIDLEAVTCDNLFCQACKKLGKTIPNIDLIVFSGSDFLFDKQKIMV